jgi:hypothetical protein
MTDRIPQVETGTTWRYRRPGSRGRDYIRYLVVTRDGTQVQVERVDLGKTATGRREWVSAFWLVDYLELSVA